MTGIERHWAEEEAAERAAASKKMMLDVTANLAATENAVKAASGKFDTSLGDKSKRKLSKT